MVGPVPKHMMQVLAIWNPLSMTKVWVPVPWKVLQVARFAPRLSAVPEQEGQVANGFTVTLRVAPLHASMKTDADASLDVNTSRTLSKPPRTKRVHQMSL